MDINLIPLVIPLEELYVTDNLLDIGTDQIDIDFKEVSDDVLEKAIAEAMNVNKIVIPIIKENGKEYFISNPIPNNKESRLVLLNAAVVDPKFFPNKTMRVVVYNKSKKPISHFVWSRFVIYKKGCYV